MAIRATRCDDCKGYNLTAFNIRPLPNDEFHDQVDYQCSDCGLIMRDRKDINREKLKIARSRGKAI